MQGGGAKATGRCPRPLKRRPRCRMWREDLNLRLKEQATSLEEQLGGPRGWGVGFDRLPREACSGGDQKAATHPLSLPGQLGQYVHLAPPHVISTTAHIKRSNALAAARPPALSSWAAGPARPPCASAAGRAPPGPSAPAHTCRPW